MTKGPPPQWSRRDCRFDHLVQAAIDAGYGTVMTYAGLEDIDRAQDVRRGIYRCAGHRKISADAGTVALAPADDTAAMGLRRAKDGTYTLTFRVFTKAQARKAHLARRGGDRSAWPYDPKRRATQGERDEWANRNELGQPVRHD